MPPKVFLKRGQGISRFDQGGLAKARADAQAKAKEAVHRSTTRPSDPVDWARPRHAFPSTFSAGDDPVPEPSDAASTGLHDAIALDATVRVGRRQQSAAAATTLDSARGEPAAAGTVRRSETTLAELSEFEQLEAAVRREADACWHASGLDEAAGDAAGGALAGGGLGQALP
eukprot:6040338-Prymnesium_polylepis.1